MLRTFSLSLRRLLVDDQPREKKGKAAAEPSLPKRKAPGKPSAKQSRKRPRSDTEAEDVNEIHTVDDQPADEVEGFPAEEASEVGDEVPEIAISEGSESDDENSADDECPEPAGDHPEPVEESAEEQAEDQPEPVAEPVEPVAEPPAELAAVPAPSNRVLLKWMDKMSPPTRSRKSSRGLAKVTPRP